MRTEGVCAVKRVMTAAVLAAPLAGCGSSGAIGDEAGAVMSGVGQDAAGEGEASTGNDAAARADAATESDASLEGGALAAWDAGAGCPASQPISGAPCDVALAQCSYGGGLCCGGGSMCTGGGTWQPLVSACACDLPVQDAGRCEVGSTCKWLQGIRACTPDDGGSLQPSCGAGAQGTPLPPCPAGSTCMSVGQGGFCYVSC